VSLWNVGEVLGVLDTYRSRRLLDEDTFRQSLRHFLIESQKMIRLGNMEIIPFTAEILAEAYALILRHHIYQGDALQVATCRTENCRLLVSADNRLIEVARGEKIEAFNIETEGNEAGRHLL